jgi:hypothetical protein
VQLRREVKLGCHTAETSSFARRFRRSFHGHRPKCRRSDDRLTGTELRALHHLQREQEPGSRVWACRRQSEDGMKAATRGRGLMLIAPGRRGPLRSSELTQPLSQLPYLACLMPQPPARGDRLGGVEAMFVIAVVRSLRPTRPGRATVHAASPFPSNGRRPAWFSRPRLGPIPDRFAQMFWLVGRVHGVVRH